VSITQELCEKIVATTADKIDEKAIAKARQLVLDGVAVAVAGARIEEAPKILADYLRGQGSKPDCSALGFGFRLAAVPAALLNATSMHVLDFEPMWMPATHALSPALAPALMSSRASRFKAGSGAPAGTSSRATSSSTHPVWWGRSARPLPPRIS
jgi:2-methylcitrate dehydratase PrpD